MTKLEKKTCDLCGTDTRKWKEYTTSYFKVKIYKQAENMEEELEDEVEFDSEWIACPECQFAIFMEDPHTICARFAKSYYNGEGAPKVDKSTVEFIHSLGHAFISNLLVKKTNPEKDQWQ